MYDGVTILGTSSIFDFIRTIKTDQAPLANVKHNQISNIIYLINESEGKISYGDDSSVPSSISNHW